TGTVDPTATGTLVNSASVAPPADTPDPVPGNDSDSDATAIAASADLVVTKSGPPRATAGSDLTFTIVVTNLGPSAASNVVVTDQTPPGLGFPSNTGDCTVAFPCGLGTLGPGASRTITSTYTVPLGYAGPDPIVNIATGSTATPDPAPANNTGRAAVSINAPVAALAVTKTDGVATLVPGTSTTYTITVANAGPSAVSGVQVSDAVPPALGGAAWTCSAAGGGSCAAASGTGSISTT